jgi:acyl dehydratase
MRMKIYSL